MQRQKYFASLPPGLLVTLLTKATTLKPDLPVFAPDFHARAAPTVLSEPQATNGHMLPQPTYQASMASHSMPIAAAPQPMPPTTVGASYTAPLQQEEYVPEDHPANYPRPGYGLMRTLPPEQEDLQWLVDEDDKFGVFSHVYQVDSHAANAGMNAGMGHAQ